jgi:hypothetical protein
MDPNNGKEIWKTLGQGHGAATAFDTRADRDDAGDTRLGRSGNYSLQIRFKIRIIKMGVRINQFHEEGEIKIWNSGRQEKP